MKLDFELLEQLFLGRVMRWMTLAALLGFAIYSPGVTILSGPSFTPASNAPLAGLLELTTDVDSRISVSVNDGAATWERNFFEYGTNHSIPLLGFKPARTNEISVIVRGKHRRGLAVCEPLLFVTGPLPGNFPKLVLRKSVPQKMDPGWHFGKGQRVPTFWGESKLKKTKPIYTLFRAANNGFLPYEMIVDSSGEVVWYSRLVSPSEVRQLENGDLFFPTSNGRGFVEYDMLGNKVKTWLAPTNLRVDTHDGVLTDYGTILYLNNTKQIVTNFPSSATDPSAPLITANVSCNRVIEISATNSALLNIWSLIDMLDPRRIDYLTFLIPAFGIDTEHANAIIEDPRDDSLIVSLRNQDAVVKFTRAGQLKWILGPHENWGPEWQPYLLTPVGTPFEWQYGQHAPILTPQGTLLLFDNGNYRAEPFDPPVADQDNYSRAVEFSIDETNMTVSQVWDYGRTNADRLYADRVGSADWLPQRQNVLITFGYVLYENGQHPSPYSSRATMVRIKEVTHEPNAEVVFDLQVFDSDNTNSNYGGCLVYRSHRIRDLYGHPAKAVADLTLRQQDGKRILEFSGDDARIYTVEVSEDLVSWQEIGLASEDDASGNFSFEEPQPVGSSKRFYRVITQ